MFPFIYKYLLLFSGVNTFIFKNLLGFLTLVADFPKCSSRFLKCLAVCFKCLKHIGKLVFMFLAITPAPPPILLQSRSPMLESLIPRSNVFLFLALLLHFLKHLFQEHAIKKKYVETQFFEKLSIWNIFILSSHLNDHLSIESCVPSFWRHFGSVIGFRILHSLCWKSSVEVLGWLSGLRVQLLVLALAEVMISGLWGEAPPRAPHSTVESPRDSLLLPLPARPQ